MSEVSKVPSLPPEQQAIRDRCLHPSGDFVAFEISEIEQPDQDRFEEQVRKCPNRIAVHSEDEEITYSQLNESANRVAWAILAQLENVNEPVASLLEQGAPRITPR